jgi:alcohol dehydrogenase class IV
VISQPGSDVKLRYRSAALPFHVALLDPELTVSLPRAVTANTGFDAFTHALEGYVSNAANVLTEPLSLSALTLLARWLPVALDAPADREARSGCLLASMQAAIAFNTTQLGMAHALSAPLGAIHHVAHGYANALALPAVTAFNEPALGAKAQAIARILGAPTAALGVYRLRAALGLDRSLDEVVPDAAARDALARAALKSGNMRTNPRSAGFDEVRGVIEAMRAPPGANP